MATSTVTTNGQITLPREIRDELGLVAGTTIKFTIERGRLIGDPVVLVRRADLWTTHPDVVAIMELSAADVDAGRTSGPLGVDEFLARLDDA